MTKDEVLDRLQAAVTAAGGLRPFAAQHGFSPSYVHDVLRRKRTPADRICEALGIERLVIYRPVGSVVGSTRGETPEDAATRREGDDT